MFLLRQDPTLEMLDPNERRSLKPPHLRLSLGVLSSRPRRHPTLTLSPPRASALSMLSTHVSGGSDEQLLRCTPSPLPFLASLCEVRACSRRRSAKYHDLMYRGKCSSAIGQKSPTTRVVSLTPLQNGGFSSQANHRAMFPFPHDHQNTEFRRIE